MNKVQCISDLEEFLYWWPFLLEGLGILNSPNGGNGNIPETRFFKILLQVISGRHSEGTVMLLTSKNDKPLAYVVLCNNTQPFAERTALCFVIYSNNKCAHAVKELHRAVNAWCVTHHYVRLYAASKRISGAAVRLFEKKWGFRQESIVFSKKVC